MAKKLDDVFDLFLPDTARARSETEDLRTDGRAPVTIATAIGPGDLTCANLTWNAAASIARSGRSVALFCAGPTTNPVWPREKPPNGLRLKAVPSSNARLAGEISRDGGSQVAFVALPWSRLARVAANGLRLDVFLHFTCAHTTKDLADFERELPGVRHVRVSVDRSGGQPSNTILCLDDLLRAVAVRRGLPQNCALSRQLGDLSRELIESTRL